MCLWFNSEDGGNVLIWLISLRLALLCYVFDWLSNFRRPMRLRKMWMVGY